MLKDHKGNLISGMNVGYESSLGNFYGHELVKEVYLSVTDKFHWITRPIKVRSGSNELKHTYASAPEMYLELVSEDEILKSYPKTWEADKVETFKKGDVLEGTSRSGKRVVLVYLSDIHVERLTESDGLGVTGWGSLQFYKDELTDIKVVQTRGNGSVPFSSLLK